MPPRAAANATAARQTPELGQRVVHFGLPQQPLGVRHFRDGAEAGPDSGAGLRFKRPRRGELGRCVPGDPASRFYRDLCPGLVSPQLLRYQGLAGALPLQATRCKLLLHSVPLIAEQVEVQVEANRPVGFCRR